MQDSDNEAFSSKYETLGNSEGFGVRGFLPSVYLPATNGG